MEIKICESCRGEGLIKVDDRHSEIDSVVCSVCEGTGKLWYRDYQLTVPFNQKDKFYKLDAEIFEIFRNIKKS